MVFPHNNAYLWAAADVGCSSILHNFIGLHFHHLDGAAAAVTATAAINAAAVVYCGCAEIREESFRRG